MRVLEEIGINHNPNARAIIYFPEGEFVLYDENDKVDGKSETMQIRAGNLVLKGAGRAKTSIVMKAPYQPLEGLDYAGPMIEFKHWSGFTPELSDIVGDAVKGSFSIEVASASGLSAGDWVCLKLEDNSPELIASFSSGIPQSIPLRHSRKSICFSFRRRSISSCRTEGSMYFISIFLSTD